MIKLLSAKEAADVLGITTQTVRSLFKKSKSFPKIKIRKNWFVEEEKLKEWLDNGGDLQDEYKED